MITFMRDPDNLKGFTCADNHGFVLGRLAFAPVGADNGKAGWHFQQVPNLEMSTSEMESVAAFMGELGTCEL